MILNNMSRIMILKTNEIQERCIITRMGIVIIVEYIQ